MKSDVHSEIVATWETNFKSGLTISQKVQLFEIAIHAIEKRARITLSGVTLLVILDRVLHQSKNKYAILSNITIESHSLKFYDLNKIHDGDLSMLLEAHRFLLLELLRVLGRLTADILTLPLHNELLKVTWNELEKK